MNTIHGHKENSKLCVLIEGPRWGDAEYYAKWLLAAAQAGALWAQAMKELDFKIQHVALHWRGGPDFGVTATALLAKWRATFASVTITLGRDNIELGEFAMMVEMGFFVLTGERYQMVVPANLRMEDVKRAARKLVETDRDESWRTHPEDLVRTMTWAHAKAWQRRLRALGEDDRCAAREQLLAGADRVPAADAA